MRLLLDANLSARRIGPPLREQGHDVRGVADEPALEGVDDESILELAAGDDRILLTPNSRDFAPICRALAEAERDHAGVILIWTLSQRQYGEIVRGVEGWFRAIQDAAGWRGIVVSI